MDDIKFNIPWLDEIAKECKSYTIEFPPVKEGEVEIGKVPEYVLLLCKIQDRIILEYNRALLAYKIACRYKNPEKEAILITVLERSDQVISLGNLIAVSLREESRSFYPIGLRGKGIIVKLQDIPQEKPVEELGEELEENLKEGLGSLFEEGYKEVVEYT
jgi:hypothetical protein